METDMVGEEQYSEQPPMVNNQESVQSTKSDKKGTTAEVDIPSTTQLADKSKKIKKNNK